MDGDSDNRSMEYTPRKCFRFSSEDNLIEKFPNPPKDDEKRQKQVRFNERGNRESHKECNNGENKNDQKIYAYMAHMSDSYECPSRDFSASSQ